MAIRDCTLSTEAAKPLEVHVGINTGEVMAGLVGPEEHRDYTVMGDSVNMAARLMSAAPPRSVLVGAETYRATRHAIRYRDLPPVLVKGKREPLPVWEAIGSAIGVESRPLGTSPLVGRDQELALLSGTWLKTVNEACPHSVTVLGEPGIGKSRLVSEFERRFCPDALVLHGRCLPYGEVLGYWALSSVLKEAAGISPETDAGTARRKLSALVVQACQNSDPAESSDENLAEITRQLALVSGLDVAEDRIAKAPDARVLHATVRRFLESLARQRPLCLVFEDIHWADDCLLDLIENVAARAKNAPLLMIAQARPQLLEKRPGWGRGVHAFTPLPLDVLPETAGRELVMALCRDRGLPEPLAAQAARNAGGNPLFAEELVAMIAERHDDGGIPSAIKALIYARLDALPAAEKTAVQLAAVFGKNFWMGGVAALGGDAELPSRLGILEQKDLLRLQPRSQFRADVEYCFKHDLIRDVAYEMLPRAERRRLHGRIVDWIETSAGTQIERHFDILAHHALAAGQDEKALKYLVKAGEQAQRATSYGQAVSLLARASEIAERLGKIDEIIDLHASRGRLFALMGKWADAKSSFAAGLRTMGAERSLRRAELLIGLAGAAFWLYDNVLLRPHAEAALAIAEEAGRNDLAAEALNLLGAAEMVDGNPRSCLSFSRRAAAKAGGKRLAQLGQQLPVGLYHEGSYRETIDAGRRLIQFCREVQDIPTMILTLPMVGAALAGMGRYGEAQNTFAEALKLGEKSELAAFHARALAVSAGIHLDLGDYSGNEQRAQEARERARAANFPGTVGSCWIDLLVNFARRGEVGRAEKMLDNVLDGVEKAAGWHGWVWKLRLSEARAELALAQEKWEESARLSDGAVAWAREFGRIKYETLGLWTRARALLRLGRRPDALADLTTAMRLARQLEDPAMILRVALTSLEIDGNDSLLSETRATAQSILAALPEGEMRGRFRAAMPAGILE